MKKASVVANLLWVVLFVVGLLGGLTVAFGLGWAVASSYVPPTFSWSDLFSALSAFGTCAAVAVALHIAGQQARDQVEAQWRAADLTIRFHTELFTSNEAYLRVALKHLPEDPAEESTGWHDQVVLAIASLRSVHFDNMRLIAIVDPLLAAALADFHSTLETLNGVLKRGDRVGARTLRKTARKYLEELDEQAARIRARTVPV